MNIPIKTTPDRFFRIAIRILNPVLKLSNTEADVLASIMLVSYANRNIDPIRLERNILSYKSRVALRSKLDMSEASLNNNISALKKKGILVKTANGFVLSEPIKMIVPEKGGLSITFNVTIQ